MGVYVVLLRYLEKGSKNGRVYQKIEIGPKEIKKKKIMEESCTCLKNIERGRSQKLTQASAPLLYHLTLQCFTVNRNSETGASIEQSLVDPVLATRDTH